MVGARVWHPPVHTRRPACGRRRRGCDPPLAMGRAIVLRTHRAPHRALRSLHHAMCNLRNVQGPLRGHKSTGARNGDDPPAAQCRSQCIGIRSLPTAAVRYARRRWPKCVVGRRRNAHVHRVGQLRRRMTHRVVDRAGRLGDSSNCASRVHVWHAEVHCICSTIRPD